MKVGLKSSVKLKNKTTIVYAVSSIVAVLVVGAFAFFYFNMGASLESIAKTQAGPEIKSTRNGYWDNGNTWEGGIVPTIGQATIQPGHTVTVRYNETIAGDVLVHGTLRINALTNITLTAPDSKIAIGETGMIVPNPNYGWLSFASFSVDGEDYWLGANTGSPTVGPTGFGEGYNELLPIELLSFKTTLTADQDTDITWVTASEENNDYFTIERSLDGKNFFTLDTIDGAGNSNEKLEYNYVDDAPVAGYNYYRLKQTDFDGKSETFEIASVFNDNAAPELNIISLGPNPYRDYFEINFTSIDESPVHLKISDMNGRTIFQKSLEAQKGNNSFTYTDRRNLQPGIYLFTIVQKGTPAKTFRLVKDS